MRNISATNILLLQSQFIPIPYFLLSLLFFFFLFFDFRRVVNFRGTRWKRQAFAALKVSYRRRSERERERSKP